MKNKKKAVRWILSVLAVVGIVGGSAALFCARKSQIEDTAIFNLRVCHLENPLGLDETNPTFSWQMAGTARGSAQQAYRIRVAQSREGLLAGDYVWDSGKVEQGISTGISYEGEELEAKTRYYWQAEIWDQQGRLHQSTEDSWFETGLMGQGMGNAKWISAGNKEMKEADREEELTYTIAYHMEVDETAAGFLFGAEGGRYGGMYLCRIQNAGGEALFQVVQAEAGACLDEAKQEWDISHCITEEGGSFDVKLQVDHEILEISVNETEIGSFQIEETPIGSIGYYKSRGNSYAWLDDVLAWDAEGNVLYEEDFEGTQNIFEPYYVAVENGRLKMGSGMMLTPSDDVPAPLFRKEFQVQDQKIASARIYMTALGSFDLSMNGQKVSEDYFSPGKLAYNRQLAYVTYDVTELLRQGESNALGIVLLHGWYDRGVGYPEIWSPWGDTNALQGRLEIVYENGKRDVIATDESFECFTDGPVRDDDLYQGEFYDANYEQVGYDTAGFAGEGWEAAQINQVREEYLDMPLQGKANEPIVCVETLSPVSVWEPEENVYVYDFGQNFTGTCRIKVTGQKGQTITLRYGEALNTEELINKDDVVGTIWTENLLTAEATDYYVLKGDGQGEVFEPEYVFHGFRYLQIEGTEEALPVEAVEGIVLSSDLERTGSFTCSDELLNQYYHNTFWGQRGNFLDNPMDCPQRDERHGWAGDAQIFSETAIYNMNSYAFYSKFLQEERILQSEGGSFPDMTSRNFGTDWSGMGGAASNNCWGDAPVIITWNLYQYYGDKRILEENYDALSKWVDMLVSTSEDYVRYWGGYGDHLSIENTPVELSDTAWCAHSADLVSRMAGVLSLEEDQEYYRQVYESFRQAWQEQFVLPDGQTTCDTQTSYALGLAFSLFPEELEEAAAARLNLLAQYSGYHINTGFSGIGYLLPSLDENGYTDSAYQMLLQRDMPSLLFPASKGATTNWEKLYAYQEQEGGYMLDGSLNHYAYGAPVSWLYTGVLGIKYDENQPGFKHFFLEPRPGGGLSFAEGSYTSTYGKISVKWEQTEKGYSYFFEVPANTTATLILPAPSGEGYLESGKEIEEAEGVTLLENNGETVKYELLSGTYAFTQK